MCMYAQCEHCMCICTRVLCQHACAHVWMLTHVWHVLIYAHAHTHVCMLRCALYICAHMCEDEGEPRPPGKLSVPWPVPLETGHWHCLLEGPWAKERRREVTARLAALPLLSKINDTTE